MGKIIFMFFVLIFTSNSFAQKNDKISVTTDRKYTVGGKSILEKDTVTISKSKLLKNKIDTTKTYFVIYDFKKGEYL